MNLDPTKLAKMLADPQFFVDCPAFAHLAEEALAAHHRYTEALKNPKCRKCSALVHMHNSLEAFKRELLTVDQRTLKTIRKYLETRIGRRADAFHVSILQDKVVRAVTF